MPRKRPHQVWQPLRQIIWQRAGGMCQYPYGPHPVTLEACHIDPIRSSTKVTPSLTNLRALCRYHHILRADRPHAGMIAKALADGLLPLNWREFVWDDDQLPLRAAPPSAIPAEPTESPSNAESERSA